MTHLTCLQAIAVDFGDLDCTNVIDLTVKVDNHENTISSLEFGYGKRYSRRLERYHRRCAEHFLV